MRRGGFHADFGFALLYCCCTNLHSSRHLCFFTRKHTDTHTLYHQSSSAYHTEHSWIFHLSLTGLSVFVFSSFLSHLYESIIYYATIILSLVLFFLLTISHFFVNDDSRPLLYFCLCLHSMTVLTLTPLNWTMDWLALFLSLSLCSILLFCHCHPPSCIHPLEWVSFSIAEGDV
ncbi:hypothetical protein BT96DRAFT_517020 [Gymnopus androsaceus JB14]|uniref:Uncharacterized protein n=1 Tax=Gymnopus androsaceus JB14 TaxID=1447944 RepID=A0A6A4I2B9_9AGAR|nr:hypothetical protein BT96DRAFT_517020 [Gymnopus androsaceus JB14]